MSDQVTVSGPIEVESNATSRVALDLMKIISNNDPDHAQKSQKEYWLKLYRQCYKATNGNNITSVLSTET